jgi:Tfp pilus assembly protein PilP
MKLTTGIVFLAMVAGTALGQNPTVINNTKVTLQAAPKAGSSAQKSGAPAAKISAKAAPKAKPAVAHQKSQPKQQIAVENQKKPAEAKSDAPTQVNMTSRRDPFVSPVVNRSMIGSGCSTGKRCLAIDQINLKGVVKADSGMIAVVVNSLNKAYFLRENDPVFNGFVVKITGDSIIFKETVQDRLGKPLTREVTKKITTSAV